MWQEMKNGWENFALDSAGAIHSIMQGSEADDSEDQSSPEYQDYSSTDRIIQTKTRIGQNFFRKAVLSAYDDRCCITGLSIPKLLVASHIVRGILIRRTGSTQEMGSPCQYSTIRRLILE